jgi:hypothetical protein
MSADRLQDDADIPVGDLPGSQTNRFAARNARFLGLTPRP